MVVDAVHRATDCPPGSIGRLKSSWELSLKADNKSPRTVQSYLEGLGFFEDFLVERNYPTQVNQISRQHVEEWIIDLLAHKSPATAKTRFNSLKPFFTWAVDEDEISRSPMANLRPPKAQPRPTRHLTTDELVAILAATDGKDFRSLRDTAIIRLYIDNGARREEIANLKVTDLDLPRGEARILAKGGIERVVPFGSKAAQALDRYLRQRDRHPHASLDHLWLGTKGAFTGDGIRQMLERVGERAGVEHLHAHRFRPTFSHLFQDGGGSEGDAMNIAGWKDRKMLDHYGTSSANERAMTAFRRRSPGDLL